MSGFMSGGHLVGAILAMLGLIALVFWSARKSTIDRLGARRWPVVMGLAAALVALGFFGSGSRQHHFRMAVGPSFGVPPGVTQADVDAALAVVTSPAFLAYTAALDQKPALAHPDKLRANLEVHVVTLGDMRAEGFTFMPEPPPGQRWLAVNYADRQNAVLAVFDEADATSRMILATTLVTDVLPQVVAIEGIRAARTEEERITALRGMVIRPRAAEWMVREFERMQAGASPAFTEALAAKIAFVRKYIEDPTMRGLPAGTRIEAP
jgi:hypothetical protein